MSEKEFKVACLTENTTSFYHGYFLSQFNNGDDFLLIFLLLFSVLIPIFFVFVPVLGPYLTLITTDNVIQHMSIYVPIINFDLPICKDHYEKRLTVSNKPLQTRTFIIIFIIFYFSSINCVFDMYFCFCFLYFSHVLTAFVVLGVSINLTTPSEIEELQRIETYHNTVILPLPEDFQDCF